MAVTRVVRKPGPAKTPVKSPIDRRLLVIICLALAIGTLAIYIQVSGFQLLQFDDVEYVIENPYIRGGVNDQMIKWAFSMTHYCSNWHPLTWVSHAVDVHLFGVESFQPNLPALQGTIGLAKFHMSSSGAHHLTNVLMHILSTVFLFLALCKMTGSMWKSAFVAALFAIHPLHVESVAWVAERKDVLSTLFWMLTMLGYAYYAEKPSVLRYLPVAAAFALGLLAKPMLVTLPFTLLLLDYWPLGRFARVEIKRGVYESKWLPVLLEKLPLWAMAAYSARMTYEAQYGGGAMASSSLTLPMRLDNAFVSYVSYIGKMLVPVNLSVVYPHPGATLSELGVAASVLVMLVLTGLVIASSKKRAYIGMGWLWFTATLVPVLGLVQVGEQGMADRYTYVPLIGLFIIITWGVSELFSRRTKPVDAKQKLAPTPTAKVTPIGVTAGVVLLTLSAVTWHQIGYWKNSETLFRHAIAITPPNIVAQINLGAYLEKMGNQDEAIQHYKEALSINPAHVRSLNLLATAYSRQGKLTEALDIYNTALKYADDAYVHNNIGVTLNELGRPAEAVPHLQKALDMRPGFARAANNLGNSYRLLNQFDKSVEQYELAISMDPTRPEAYANRGLVQALRGRFDEAISDYRTSLSIDPSLGYVHARLAAALYNKGQYAEAASEVDASRQLGTEVDPQLIAAITARLHGAK